MTDGRTTSSLSHAHGRHHSERHRRGPVPLLMVGSFVSRHHGSYSVSEALADRLRQNGWDIIQTSSRRNPLVRAADMAWTAWRHRRTYDIAHIDVFSGRAFGWAEAVSAVLRLSGKPYVLTLRGGNLPAFAGRWPKRVNVLLGGAAAVVAPSEYLLDQMRRYRSDLHLIRNPLNLSLHNYRRRDRVTPAMIWVRAFNRIYDPPMAVRVLAAVLRAHPNAHLTMVGPDTGDGSLEETQRLANSLQVSHRLRLTGRVRKTEVPRYLDQADIFLNTTTVDNAPVSVLEGMASGLCIVSTNVGGIPYMLQHDETALLVPAGDAATIAGAVIRLISDSELAARLSANARAQAEKHSWEDLIIQWETILAGQLIG